MLWIGPWDRGVSSGRVVNSGFCIRAIITTTAALARGDTEVQLERETHIHAAHSTTSQLSSHNLSFTNNDSRYPSITLFKRPALAPPRQPIQENPHTTDQIPNMFFKATTLTALFALAANGVLAQQNATAQDVALVEANMQRQSRSRFG